MKIISKMIENLFKFNQSTLLNNLSTTMKFFLILNCFLEKLN